MRCYSLFRNFAPPFALEQVGMEATACFPTNENVFTLLRVAKIVFDYRMTNDPAPISSTITARFTMNPAQNLLCFKLQ
jgi:hypothetical protein